MSEATLTLVGWTAIECAQIMGVAVTKWNDPIEPAQEMNPSDARRVAAEDPSLLTMTVPARHLAGLAALHESGWSNQLAFAVAIAQDIVALPKDAPSMARTIVENIDPEWSWEMLEYAAGRTEYSSHLRAVLDV